MGAWRRRTRARLSQESSETKQRSRASQTNSFPPSPCSATHTHPHTTAISRLANFDVHTTKVRAPANHTGLSPVNLARPKKAKHNTKKKKWARLLRDPSPRAPLATGRECRRRAALSFGRLTPRLPARFGALRAGRLAFEKRNSLLFPYCPPLLRGRPLRHARAPPDRPLPARDLIAPAPRAPAPSARAHDRSHSPLLSLRAPTQVA